MSKDQQANRAMDIGTPYNAKHITHVGFDAKSGQFTGLPPDWQILLKHSGITEQEQQQHPQVIHILNIVHEHTYYTYEFAAT